MFLKLSRVHLILPLLCATALTACDGAGVKVGPFPVAVDLGSGTFSAESLGVPAGTKGTTSFELPLCNLPSEDDLNVLLAENVDETVARLVSLSEIIVRDVTLLATRGDFGGLTAIAVFYVPAPLLGIPQLPVALGSATALEGFGVEVNLQPLNEVNLLDVVRENDSNPGDECPTLLVVLTGEVPASPIDWEAMIMADVYGLLSF
jgi:hypothetical protein